MKIEGNIRPSLQALQRVQLEFRQGLFQKALNRAARPIIKRAKANARKIPKDSGTLAKSIETRRRKRGRRGVEAWVGIGTSSGEFVVKQTGWRGKKYVRPARPSSYAHLKETGGLFGRFNRKYRVRGYPLFESAVTASAGEFERAFTAEVQKGIEDAYAKGRVNAYPITAKVLEAATS